MAAYLGEVLTLSLIFTKNLALALDKQERELSGSVGVTPGALNYRVRSTKDRDSYRFGATISA